MTTDDRPTDTSDRRPGPGHAPVPRYEIRVRGHLDTRWAAWFDGLDLSTEDDGTTVIRGPVVDQAALHGLLQRLRDVGIPLVALAELPPDGPTPGPAPTTPKGTRP